MPVFDATTIALLATALVLGLRHGFDWDHLAAITDITSTTSAAEAAEVEHEEVHESGHGHEHEHGGETELRTHEAESVHEPHEPHTPVRHQSFLSLERQPVLLGTLYALGHGVMVAILGGIAIYFGALLPEWVDPLMGRIVGLTLLLLGIFVFVSLYHYARHGTEFRLRSRWMLVFDGVRYSWRRFQGWLHGHSHVEPLEMSSYGPRTAFTVGMIHGIGAETGTQILFIAAIGGAASGLAVPMMIAFIVGLLITNTIMVVISSSGFLASQRRRQIYVVIGAVAGAFSLVIGTVFLLGIQDSLPSLEHVFG